MMKNDENSASPGRAVRLVFSSGDRTGTVLQWSSSAALVATESFPFAGAGLARGGVLFVEGLAEPDEGVPFSVDYVEPTADALHLGLRFERASLRPGA